MLARVEPAVSLAGIGKGVRESVDTAEKARETAFQRKPVESLKRLLGAAIDYAGLFPPAALTMAAAVDEYAACRAGPFSWMLGCLVVPAARLEELSSVLDRRSPAESGKAPWLLTAIASEAVEADVAAILRFNSHPMPAPGMRRAMIDSIEIKVKGPEDASAAARQIPGGLRACFEVPLSGVMPECLAAIRDAQGFAKLRTGGVKPDQFPVCAAVARFIEASVRLGLAFKATAGLHHAIRAAYPLANESVVMHGFLNLLIGAALSRAGVGEAQTAEALEERDPNAFRFNAEGASWRVYRLTSQHLAEARRHSVRSFGSCSFAEPVGDLRALHLL